MRRTLSPVQIKRIRLEGEREVLSNEEIAELVGCSGKTVSCWLNKLGFERANRAGRQEDSFWSEENEAILRELWEKERLSTSDVARILACSRNAVIGKAHRLGLSSRPSPIRDILRDRQRDGMSRAAWLAQGLPTTSMSREDLLELLAGGESTAEPASVKRERATTCQRPIGEDTKRNVLILCGNPAVEGKPYCERCCGIVYLDECPRKLQIWYGGRRW